MTRFFGACISAAVLVWMAESSAVAGESPGAPGAAERAGQGQATPLPPEGSPPLLRTIEFNFDAQGGTAGVEMATYFHHTEIENYVSSPSGGRWVPYTEATEQILLEDFRRLWDTGFLDDLSIEVIDEPYSNGVMGKRVIFRFEERSRIRTFTFEGSDVVDRTDIDTAMSENGLSIRLDAFLDPGIVRQVESLVRAMFSAEGYPFATVRHEISELAGSVKVVQMRFLLVEGPKVHVEEIEFVGNSELSDRELKGQMKQIKERWWLSWINGRGTYKEALFEEDADRLVARYLDKGYIDAQIGQPETVYLVESPDGTTRGMRLRIPVDEGRRFRIGAVRFDGNEVVNDFGMTQVFGTLEPGEYYSQKEVIEAIEATRELYGSRGYTELTVFPDLQRRTSPEYAVGGDVADASTADELGGNTAFEDIGEASQAGDDQYADLQRPTHILGDPIVDVTMRIEEGEQHFVNRITFVGNESTHDEVIRREMQLVENGVFNTAALKNSIRRVNQLGYFEPLEESQVDIENVEGEENQVDLRVNLIEANLNQLTFGMGISQFDGFFGQLSFATTNFLGRGETLSVGVQSGSRLRNINLGYTRPYMFNRSISTGVNLYSRRIEYIGAYTEDSNGGSVTLGWPMRLFTWGYLTYSYEDTSVGDVSSYFGDNPYFAGNPFFADALQSRTVSKIAPSMRHNTVDHPIFPFSGKSFTATMELAGLGGDTRFWKPILVGTWYIPHLSRTTIGLRLQYQFIGAGTPDNIPVFERLWLGGEFSVRGFDIRRIGPTVSDVDPDVSPESFQGRTVFGGNKSLLVNAEYQITIAQPVRFILFYDAGQVQDFGLNFTMNDFKTSTGLELRFFMPVLNVPFRLIYAWNPQRDGVFNDQFQPQEERVFRFAVGTTF